MSCARCGCGIYKTEEFISLNKVWHKYCFTCYQCSKHLDKDSAKIFQGELFCECCYTSVIEKLFEVISTPSLNKPCKVVSSPSCAVSKTCTQKLKDCEACLQSIASRYQEYCFPADKKVCIPRNIQSCSCIPSQQITKNEHCFLFPIPREVANYYNRSHMRPKTCKDPITCYPQAQCPACRCRKTCYPEPKMPMPIRILKNQCGCNSCSQQCGVTPPKACCCSKPPPPCTPVFTKGCSCCLPQESDCYDPCSPRPRCPSPCPPPHPQACWQKKCCKPKCSPKPYCPPQVCCRSHYGPVSKCSSPAKYCPATCGPSPGCPPIKWCPPQQCCPPKTEGCAENPPCCCKGPITACGCRSPKYCVCGNLSPCNCKMSQIRTQCSASCNRCGQKVYAAEKVLVSCGAYHTSCFTCYCCNKYLDVKNVFEGCGEIYCKQCYNHFFGIQYYGFGRPNC